MNSTASAVYGAVLALIIGWVLYIGQSVFVPIVFGVLVVYVIVGLTRLLLRTPYLGRMLPVQVRYTLSVLIIGLGFFVVVYLLIAHKDSAIALAPQYQSTLLATIQKGAVFLRIESEPTWATLRAQLDHVTGSKIQAPYDRARRLELRVRDTRQHGGRAH